jgi:hypothetical protein
VVPWTGAGVASTLHPRAGIARTAAALAVIEWVDRPFTGGQSVPDLVSAAGGLSAATHPASGPFARRHPASPRQLPTSCSSRPVDFAYTERSSNQRSSQEHFLTYLSGRSPSSSGGPRLLGGRRSYRSGASARVGSSGTGGSQSRESADGPRRAGARSRRHCRSYDRRFEPLGGGTSRCSFPT